MTAWFACKPRRQLVFGLPKSEAGSPLELLPEIPINIGRRRFYLEHMRKPIV